MKKIFATILILVFTFSAHAQSTSARARKKKAPPSRTQPYYQLGTGVSMWHEFIEAERNGIKGRMSTQSLGARLGITRNQFTGPKSRWRKTYAADALVGTVKGKTTILGQNDELDKQPWLAVMGTAGWVYRTSPASEMGLIIPVVARYISWDLKAGSDFKMDREFSFSAGAGALFTQRFDTKNAMHISLVHQQLWKSTMWTISWEQTL